MKTKMGSLSILALALIFGLSTCTFSQGDKKTMTTKTEKKTVQTQPVVKENKSPEKNATTMASKDSKTGHKKLSMKSKTETKAMTPEKK